MQLTSASRTQSKYARFRFCLAAIAIVAAPWIAPSPAWGRGSAAWTDPFADEGEPATVVKPKAKAKPKAKPKATPTQEEERQREEQELGEQQQKREQEQEQEQEEQEIIRLPTKARVRPQAAEASTRGNLSVHASTEISAYSDTDAVHVLSPTISGSVADEVAGWSIGGSYLVDVVSAASVDIVSTASSHWVEERHVGSASASFSAGPAAVALAGGFSREPDYLSITGGGVISFELAEKNVMPFVGGSYGHDLVGRTGDPMDIWPQLNTVSLKLGVTFVVNRSTIASLSFDEILERGYLAKPYRYLPVVPPGVGSQVPAGASIDLVKSLNVYSVAENVPTERNRSALSGRLAYRSERATFRGDQRLYYDSWGLMASTTDVHEYIDLSSSVLVWPHLRAHVQNGVVFWRRITEQVASPVGPPGIPTYRAGDRELGPLYTLTAGLGTKIRLNSDIHAPWALSFQLDGMYTRYLDAIYISRRWAIFGALGLEAAF